MTSNHTPHIIQFNSDVQLNADLSQWEARQRQSDLDESHTSTEQEQLEQAFKSALLQAHQQQVKAPLSSNDGQQDEHYLRQPAEFARPYRDIRSDLYFHPTMVEVLSESLDYSQGPHLAELFHLFLQMVGEGHAQAINLFERMATTYASHAVE